MQPVRRKDINPGNRRGYALGFAVMMAGTLACPTSGAARTLSDRKFFVSHQSFSQACDAAVHAGAQLVVSQKWQDVAGNCPGNVSFAGDGSIVYTGAVVFSGSVVATPTVHFVHGGTGTLTFSNTSKPFSFSWWGVVADGTDQTVRFQDAIDSLHNSGGGSITIPSAPHCYAVNALKYYSNITFSGETRSTCVQKLGGELSNKVPPGGSSVFYSDAMTPISNVHFRNFTIDGNKSNVRGVTGDGGNFGIIFLGASNSSVDNMTITDAYTDGIEIDGSGPSRATLGSGLTISHTLVTRSRRNNIALVAGLNTTISNCELSYASGTNPAAGIDVEQYEAGAYVTGLQIVDSEMHHNDSDGVLLNLTNQDDPNLEVTIRNVNAHDNGVIGLHGVNFTKFGKLVVEGGTFTNNHGCCGMVLAGWQQITISAETTSGSSRGILIDAHDPSVVLGPGSISGTDYDLSVDGADSRVTLDGATLVHGIIQPGEESRVTKGSSSKPTTLAPR